jgi:hypothetical protein
MERIDKFYTPAFAREMLNKIQNGVINETEAVELRRKLMDTIEQKYSSFMMQYCGGIIQPERRFVNHVWNSMNTLKLEYTDLNIFVAACAMSSVMLRKYSGMQGFPMVPDLSQYNTDAGIADLMNKIVAFYNGDS